MIGLLDLIGFALGGAIVITMAIGIVLSVFMPALDTPNISCLPNSSKS